MHKETPAQTYIVSPSRLQGSVRLSGAKNSALRLLAGSLLTHETVVVDNYPAGLLDAQIHVGMLQALGKHCEVGTSSIAISEDQKLGTILRWEGRSIRNTLLVLGALTARFGYGAVPLPGGCTLGERKYDLHVMLLEQMGAHVFEEGGMLCAECKGKLRGANIYLPLRSTGATENGIICGCLADGTTRIWNPHVRPEIIDLIDMLNAMGAEIRVYGQERIEVVGKHELHSATHRTIPDSLEALTWLVGAAITGGDIEILGFPYQHLEVPLIHLRESGVRMYRCDDRMVVRGGTCYPLDISTGPYPGINSDMQPIMAVFAARANGVSKIVDLRFADRYGYANELAKMGLHHQVAQNTLTIEGGKPLHGAEVIALDLRAGIALALAGTIAEGTTLITDAWQISRGYDDFVGKYRSLGGSVEVA